MLVSDHYNSGLAIDFMKDLPAKSASVLRFMMIIVDRLKDGVVIEEMNSMKAEECVKVFLKRHFRYHVFSKFLTSDCDSNRVGDFWHELCRLTGIEQRLSTAFHPQSDGAIERMNQEILSYLRAFVINTQLDWKDLLPCAMLALNKRTLAVLGMSLFFAEHGYHIDPIQMVVKISIPTESAKGVIIFVKRLCEAQELAQAAVASS